MVSEHVRVMTLRVENNSSLAPLIVLLEAMACGLPVAAYPVTGPIDVLGDSDAGVMREDLREACLAALKIDRKTARAHAEKFSWRAATEQFVSHLQVSHQLKISRETAKWAT